MQDPVAEPGAAGIQTLIGICQLSKASFQIMEVLLPLQNEPWYEVVKLVRTEDLLDLLFYFGLFYGRDCFH